MSNSDLRDLKWWLRGQGTTTASRWLIQIEKLEEDSKKLKNAINRMDRARNILTNGNPTPHNNWGVLDTTDLKL